MSRRCGADGARSACSGCLLTDLVVQTRAASHADFDHVMAIQVAAGRTPSERFRELTAASIDDPTAHVVVGTVEERIIGWATTRLFTEPDGAAPAGHYLMGVTVIPAMRRRGIATRLIGDRLDWIASRADTAFYFTNARNRASIAAHERRGFLEIARASYFRNVPFDGGEGILFAVGLGPAPT
jgi:aminoglycoside 6'-N-acetyltransferase I